LSEGTGERVSVAPPLAGDGAAQFRCAIKVTPAGNTQVADVLRVAGKVDFDQAG
jgi:hypothetical protein